MAVLSVLIQFQLSGGTTNEDPNLSLGGQISTATHRNVISHVLHNLFDEVTNAEAVSGEYEVRHFYFRNAHTFKVRNARLVVVADLSSRWSKLEFAKGTAANGTVEQAVPDENTLPAGISDDDWKIPTLTSPLLLGDVEPDSSASIWVRRKVEPGALIARGEHIHVRIIADPPIPVAPPIECDEGEHYDEDTETCVPDDDPNTQCPPDEVLQNGQCVPIASPPPPEPVVITAVGDIGCNTNAELTLSAIRAVYDVTVDENKQFLNIANGDLSYSSSADCFLENLEFIELFEHTRISIGNHDDEEDGSSSLRSAFLSAFGVQSGGYYSFDIQNIHVLVMDTQSNYSLNSPQYIFARNDMAAAASNSQIDWIVVFYHKPSMTISSNHSALTDFRDLYHPLFDLYKVDIIVTAHNHNMQRTYPLKHNTASPATPTIVSTVSTNVYTNLDARVFVVSGAGGRSHYDLPGSRPSHFAFSEDGEYGIFLMEWVDNNKTFVGRFIAISEGEALEELDRFQINKTT